MVAGLLTQPSEVARNWLELGLEGEFSTIVASGAGYFLRAYLSPIWEEAVDAGIVQGKPRDAITAALDALYYSKGLKPEPGRSAGDPARGVRRTDVNRIFGYVRQVMRSSLLDLQAQYDAGFMVAAEEMLRKAALGKWGRERYVDSMMKLAEGYGAVGFKAAHAATWYRTVILNAGYNQGMLVAFNGQPTMRLYPFLAYRTVGDERVRPNHAALAGLVAPTSWPGWREYTPPLGWNCRCRLVPVSYAVARELGWLDQKFPRGEEFFRPLIQDDGELLFPGFDPDFPSPLQAAGGLLPF